MSHDFVPRIRALPFDLAACLSHYPNPQALIRELSQRPGGISTELWRLGLSIMIEFGEAQLTFLDRNCKSDFKASVQHSTFIRQELVHSSHHHQLNKFLEGRYKTFRHGQMKCNYLNFPHAAKRELLHNEILRPSSGEARAQALKTLTFANTVFEVTIGIYDALTYFQVYEENSRLLNEVCPFLTYLWLYHYTEELEHVHVALERFEENFNSSIFSQENYPGLERAMDAASDIPISIGIELALKNNFEFSFAELHASPYHQKSRQNREKYKLGFDLKDIAAVRRHYIDLFDKKIEPELRAAVAASNGRPTRFVG